MSAIRVVESSGSIGSLQVADGSGGFLSGSLIAGSNISIADNGSGNFTIASTGGGSTIGDAEDGDYTDGLFVDFATTTPIGTAVDRFNEIFKSLVHKKRIICRTVSPLSSLSKASLISSSSISPLINWSTGSFPSWNSFIKFGMSMGYSGIMTPNVAAWMGNVIFSIGGILLLLVIRK